MNNEFISFFNDVDIAIDAYNNYLWFLRNNPSKCEYPLDLDAFIHTGKEPTPIDMTDLLHYEGLMMDFLVLNQCIHEAEFMVRGIEQVYCLTDDCGNKRGYIE